ncbi:MAG: hypothetical protein IPJ34_23020 [Myxococcales bacterium]|nr:hypothetical protein [Myxococcales bacterium]
MKPHLTLGLCVLALGVFPLGCTQEPQPMTAGSEVPASEGTVLATAGANGHTHVVIRVKHLALPGKVQSDSNVYVVWIQPLNGHQLSAGPLTLDIDLQGTFETVTPHRRFLLTVTPEPDPKAAFPTHDPVFSANIVRAD